MLKNQRGLLAVIALVLGLGWILLANFLPLPLWLKILLFDSQAQTYPWTIQNVMWIAFAFCGAELWYRWHHANACQRVLRNQYLPEDATTVLIQEDMSAIYKKLKDVRNELADIICNLALRFQAGNVVDESHALLNTRLELWQYQLDIHYSFIRYLIWLIPTLGFIGTVVGISRALNFAALADPNAPTLLAHSSANCRAI